MIEIVMMLVALMALAKKNEKDRIPRWIQLTIDGTGGPKGSCDWLKPGFDIQPLTIESGTCRQFEKDGFTMPEFKEDIYDNDCFIIYGRDDLALPLLVHQKPVVKQLANWMAGGDLEGVVEYRGPIDIFHLDQTKDHWNLKFSRGKKQFDPYRVKATVITKDRIA